MTGTFGCDYSGPDTHNSPGSGIYVGVGFWIATVVGGPQTGGTFNFWGLNVVVTNPNAA